MDLTAVITLAFVAAVLGLMLYGRLSAGKAVGRPVKSLLKEIPGLEHADPCLIYCYSPGCPPCRSMTPHIDKLAGETGKVFKLDVSSHMELAREIGIRATPTTLVVSGGQIRKVIIGVKSPAQLLEALENAT